LITAEIIGYMIHALAQEELLWGMGVLACFIPLIWFVIAILIAIWVYKDAEAHGMNGVLWLIVVLVGGLIGLIIYLIVRSGAKGREETIKRICPHCGRVVKEDVKFCPHCGKELE